MGRPADTAGAAKADDALPLAPAIGFSMAGQVVYLLSQLAILASLTRLRGPAAVGEFGLAIALCTPFFMFVSMGGKMSQSSDVKQRYSFAEYGALVAVLACLGVIGSMAAGFVFAKTGHALLIVGIIALTKAAESVSNLAYGAFQQAGRPDKISNSLMLRGALTVPLFIALLLAGVAVGVAFLAQFVVWTSVALARDYPSASRIAAGKVVRPSGDWRRIAILARETAPLGMSFALGALLNSLPRLFVERMIGLSAVGVLTIVTYFQQAGSIMISAISQPLINRFARLRYSGDVRALRRTQLALLVLVGGCSIAGIIFVALAGEWLLWLVFGPELASASDLLLLIALALSAKLLSVVPQSLLHADRRYTAFLYREVASVVICFILLALLVPPLGLMGAGFAILGSAIFRLVVITLAAAIGSKNRAANVGSSVASETTAL